MLQLGRLILLCQHGLPRVRYTKGTEHVNTASTALLGNFVYRVSDTEIAELVGSDDLISELE